MRLRLVFVVGVIAGCLSNSSVAAPRAASSPRAAYEAKVRLLEQVFQSRTRDQAVLRSLYTKDAVLVEADGNTIVGRDQVVRDFEDILASGAVLAFKVRTTMFRTNGNISYAGGVEEIDERDGQTVRHVRHRFLEVLERGGDGVWRMAYVLEAAA